MHWLVKNLIGGNEVKLKTKRIICLYGGPGSGKSTACAGLFYKLKQAGFNCEMNREYIKEWVWEGRTIKGGDQTYFFAKQSRSERIYIDNDLDFIITDSPLLLAHFYGLKYDEFERKSNTSLSMLKSHHEFCRSKGYKAEHFFLNRVKEYNPAGRLQSAEEAKSFDLEMRELLDSMRINYKSVDADEFVVDKIVSLLSLSKDDS